MPSGQHGCSICGKPTKSMLRIRVEDFVPIKRERDGKRKVIGSYSRSFCMDHVDEAFDEAIVAVKDYIGEPAEHLGS